MSENLRKELEELRKENAKLKQEKRSTGNGLSFKVSAKGGISVYGLGRFPVTLYDGQWERLIKDIPKLEEFRKTNKQFLATKE